MRRHESSRARRRPFEGWPGFTLVELMIVLIIIGILVGFILTAAMDGVRRAEERSTQALIAKLDAGMNDRLEALLAQSVEVNDAHAYLAGLWYAQNAMLPSTARAYTIAKIDYLKAEMPDVFVVQSVGNAGILTHYLFNFAAGAYPGTPAYASLGAHAGYMLPMGAGILNDPINGSYGAATTSLVTTGIHGASYSVAAGLVKQLHEHVVKTNPAAASAVLTPANRGYDGVDNDGNGLVDELGENGKTLADAMYAQLGNHTHKTARSEMLYALLVEGQGPLGSVFSRDDFRDNEVMDTDGDGLLEFVDSWGEPLQFYRWPIFYPSDTQRGLLPYANVIQARDQNPLDPNQQLMNPAWWGAGFNAFAPYNNLPNAFAGPPLSNAAGLFQGLFFTLTDPRTHPNLNPTQGPVWDRGPNDASNPTFPRGAFASRFLILSGGPDRTPGV
ncbi:MAG: prepilin-type N-terminal cleavage/methylation domain-containing protein, partial [Isosphaeraceae bacterium]